MSKKVLRDNQLKEIGLLPVEFECDACGCKWICEELEDFDEKREVKTWDGVLWACAISECPQCKTEYEIKINWKQKIEQEKEQQEQREQQKQQEQKELEKKMEQQVMEEARKMTKESKTWWVKW